VSNINLTQLHMLTIKGMEFEILYNKEEIQSRVAEVAQQIQQDFQERIADTVILTVLEGAKPFSRDLQSHLEGNFSTDEIKLQSYKGGTKSTGKVEVVGGLKSNVRGKHVVVVEDVVDSGLTYHELHKILIEQGAESVSMCTLFYKPTKHQFEDPIAYVGFEIGEEFIIGYGLDLDEDEDTRALKNVYVKLN